MSEVPLYGRAYEICRPKATLQVSQPLPEAGLHEFLAHKNNAPPPPQDDRRVPGIGLL